MSNTYINDAGHRLAAADWHGGQWSAFYAYASTGVLRPEDRDRFASELAENLVEAARFHPGDVAKLQALGTHVLGDPDERIGLS